MADLNYEVPSELAAAFKKFCDAEGLKQRVSVRWAIHQLMRVGLSERREWINQYNEWLSLETSEPPAPSKLTASQAEAPPRLEQEDGQARTGDRKMGTG